MQFIARKQQANMLFYVSILSSLDIKLKFLTSWVELTSLTNSWVLISQSHAANHHVGIVDIVGSWLDQRVQPNIT